MFLKPESSFVVQATAHDEILCNLPTGTEQRVKVADLGSVLFETADDALFGLGATGEQAALDRLRALPEFKIRRMNSSGSGRFLCWESPRR